MNPVVRTIHAETPAGCGEILQRVEINYWHATHR
jgi:hypothetical protein